MSGHNLEPHPKVQRLLEEIALLRGELAERLAELQDLQQVVKPNLLAIYQTKLGAWELRLLEIQCEVARLKRKSELVQASLNRGEKPNLVAIDLALEVEFLAWKQRVQEAAQKIEAAQSRLSHLLSPAENAKLKKLYYALVKKLHPDVNPSLTDDQKELWLQVTAAYEGGDLQKLEALALVVEKGDEVTGASSIETLQAEHERLRMQVMQLLRQIAEIQKQPPFSMRREWEDENWIAARRDEIDAQVAALRKQSRQFENHLKALLLVHGPGKQFGHN